jgi:hypothetical protein
VPLLHSPTLQKCSQHVESNVSLLWSVAIKDNLHGNSRFPILFARWLVNGLQRLLQH